MKLNLPLDVALAAEWYAESAALHFAAAQFGLGECYEKGVGVAQDAALAVKWFVEAAALGY